MISKCDNIAESIVGVLLSAFVALESISRVADMSVYDTILDLSDHTAYEAFLPLIMFFIGLGYLLIKLNLVELNNPVN